LESKDKTAVVLLQGATEDSLQIRGKN